MLVTDIKETEKERHSKILQHTDTKRTVFCFSPSVHFLLPIHGWVAETTGPGGKP